MVEGTALEMRHRGNPIGGSNPPASASFVGGVAEWFKAAVLKTAIGQPIEGSNPSPTAIGVYFR